MANAFILKSLSKGEIQLRGNFTFKEFAIRKSAIRHNFELLSAGKHHVF